MYKKILMALLFLGLSTQINAEEKAPIVVLRNKCRKDRVKTLS